MDTGSIVVVVATGLKNTMMVRTSTDGGHPTIKGIPYMHLRLKNSGKGNSHTQKIRYKEILLPPE